MSALEHDIENGIVVTCSECTGPIRKVYYTHECSTEIFKDKKYCLECMIDMYWINRICRRCKKYMGELSQTSFSKHRVQEPVPIVTKEINVQMDGLTCMSLSDYVTMHAIKNDNNNFTEKDVVVSML
jgi:hypothetical protein